MEEKKTSSKPLIAGLLSVLTMGLGQLYNKQYFKAIFFFAFQLVLMLIELTTSWWIDLLIGSVPWSEFALRKHGGFISRGVWGFITLGEVPGARNDHSIVLMNTGIIVILFLALFAIIYVWNIKDAYSSRKQIDLTGHSETIKQFFKKVWEQAFEYLVLMPGIVMLIFFSLLPILFSLLVAFTNYNVNNLPPNNLVKWVGFSNFTNIFKLPIWGTTFVGILQWTIIWAVLATFTCFAMGIFQAVIIASKKVKLKKLWRSIYILPWAIPGLISLLVFKTILNTTYGPLNKYLMEWGIISSNIGWLIHPTTAKITLVLVNLWLGFPYFMSLASGIMTSISDDLYEAAKIDGATARQEFWKITLPIVLYSISPLLVMSFAHNFNNFGAVFYLTEGGPANAAYVMAGHTDLLISWIYKLTVNNRMYNMASVLSAVIFVVIGGLSAWNFTRTKAFKEDF